MLTLLYGTDWTANRDYILNMLAHDVSCGYPNRILLVPELISHDTERRLCAVAGDTCSRFAEVLSFSRLTKRICDWSGCGIQECLDNGGRLVAMAAAARQLHSRLKAYASVETKPEFLSDLVNAVDEFKRCCITAEDLEAASVQAEGVFAQKLEELALLLDAYDAICQQGKRDPRDQLMWGLEQLNECDFAQNHTFYIDGFPDFTLQNMEVIAYLIQNAPHIVISINCDKPGSSHLAFKKAGETASKILRIADMNGIKTEILPINAKNKRFLPLCDKLFQGKITAQPSYAGKLRTVQAGSVIEECTLASEQIMELVHKGARYRDISVVCTDIPAYANTLSMYLQRCGIPTYVAGTEDILDKSVINTILTALDAALNGFDTKDVLRYLKSPLSPLPIEDCDRLENYVLLWSINGSKWLQSWTMHPEGLQDVWTDKQKADLAYIDHAREFVIAPLQKMSAAFRISTCVKQQTQALFTFLEDIQMQHRLSELAREMDSIGDDRNAQILNQLWEILLSALEQMEDTLGATHWENEAFCRLFRLLLSQYDVGTIPPVLDTVTIGPISAMRCQEVRHLIVVGAAEGKFPAYGSSSGVLSDHERTSLRQMGIPLTGSAAEGLEITFSEIYSIFCGISDTIYVSSPSGQTSYLYRRLAEMAGCEYQPSYVLGAAAADQTEAASLLCRSNQQPLAETLGLSRIYSKLDKMSSHMLGSVSSEGIQKLYGTKLNLSASQVDKQADCRLAYFLKYGLRLKEQKAVSVDPAEFGTYVHDVLENTAREICRLGGFKAVSLEQTMSIAKRYSDEYTKAHFSQIDSERIAYLFQRNDRELMMIVEELWKEFQESSFTPIEFELAFGDGAVMPAIEIPNGMLPAQLRGFVDRVDVWQEDGRNYYRVVDYKTGKKDFDYCDVFNGLGLQMLLYLFALEREGEKILGSHPIPAGIQYFPARAPILSADSSLSDEKAESERQKHWKRKGLLLDDEDVLYAMENSSTPVRLCYHKYQNGNVSGDLASREQFKILNRYVFRLLGRMVEDIASGNVTPNPYTRGTTHNACRYCPYGAVCHSATVADRRNYKTISSQRFWEEIEKELSQRE